jgi:AraC family transcriptional regulator of arabinose operon
MILASGTAEHQGAHGFVRAPGFPHWSLGLVLAGRMRLTSSQRTVEIAAGGFALVRPRTPYAVVVEGDPAREAWALFGPGLGWDDLLAWPEALPGVGLVPAGTAHTASAAEALLAADRWRRLGTRLGVRLAGNALEQALLLLAADAVDAGAGQDPGLRAALELIGERCGEHLDVAALARCAGMSPSHFAHRFAAALGESPMRHLEGRRIERARHLLLATDLPVKAVAAACGFPDPLHFARRFRTRTGQTPSGWRTAPKTG